MLCTMTSSYKNRKHHLLQKFEEMKTNLFDLLSDFIFDECY